MNLEELRKHVIVLPANEAREIRRKYIETFVDTTSEYYGKYLQTSKDCLYYEGYLWDAIKERKVIDFNVFTQQLNKLGDVLVMWDIHNENKFAGFDMKLYWAFGRESVVNMKYNILYNHRQFFPTDIYIFDRGFKWTLITTHENTQIMTLVKGKPRYKRLLFSAGDI